MESQPTIVSEGRVLQVDARRLTLGLAVVGGTASVFAVLIAVLSSDIAHLLHAYLLNFAFYLSLSLGSLFFVIVHHLTRRGWSVVIRRVAEMLAAALPAMTLLFLPIALLLLFGNASLYEWNDPELAKTDALIQNKTVWLNAGFFSFRGLVYFAFWSVAAWYYLRQSLRHDETGDPKLTLNMRWWSPLAMIGFGVTVTFASFDFLMSLDPHWFSTIFGVYYFSGCLVGFFAVIILCAVYLERQGALAQVITTEHYHDLGKLLFAFVFFWGYIAYSQYMLIWYANIPEETGWYLVRQSSAWKWVSLALLFGHLIIPFVGLMSRSVKRRRASLAVWAILVLAMHWLDMYWLVTPQLSPERPPFGLLDLCLLVALGCFYGAVLLRIASGRSLVPLRDPQLSESLAFENI